MAKETGELTPARAKLWLLRKDEKRRTNWVNPTKVAPNRNNISNDNDVERSFYENEKKLSRPNKFN